MSATRREHEQLLPLQQGIPALLQNLAGQLGGQMQVITHPPVGKRLPCRRANG